MDVFPSCLSSEGKDKVDVYLVQTVVESCYVKQRNVVSVTENTIEQKTYYWKHPAMQLAPEHVSGWLSEGRHLGLVQST